MENYIRNNTVVCQAWVVFFYILEMNYSMRYRQIEEAHRCSKHEHEDMNTVWWINEYMQK